VKRYNFFLPEQVVDALRKEAERTGLTMSELIRRILTDGLKKYEPKGLVCPTCNVDRTKAPCPKGASLDCGIKVVAL
jgi:hypothetical protein